jgi:hypothetical protein
MTGTAATVGGAGSPRGASGTVAVVEPPENTIAWRVFGSWLAILTAALIGGYFAAPEVPNSGFVSATAVLTFITTAAVGIERIIEGAFALLGRSSGFGGWWPLKQVSGAIKTFEENTNAYVARPLADAIQELETLKTAAVNAGDLAQDVQAAVEAKIAAYARTRDELQARLDNLDKLAPGSPRFDRANELAATATKTMNEIAETASRISGGLGETVLMSADRIAGAANRAGDIVVSFADNPARKVLSLMVGSILGVAVASFMGLNLFLAVLDDPSADAPSGTDTGICDGGAAACLDGRAGVLVTGLVIGLGANPTHEVIKALQRRRRNGADGDDDASESGATVGPAFNVLGAAVPAAGPPAATSIRRRQVRSTD